MVVAMDDVVQSLDDSVALFTMGGRGKGGRGEKARGGRAACLLMHLCVYASTR